MDEEYGAAADTANESADTDFSDAGDSDYGGDSIDVGQSMDFSADTGESSDASFDLGGQMDGFSDLGEVMDEPEPYSMDQAMEQETDLPMLQDGGALTDILAESEDIEEAAMDAESYRATPNSEIPILQEDGSVDTLEHIMEENADTDDAPMDTEPYHATPNSEIPILQEDGSVDTLEHIMEENAETDDAPIDMEAELDGDTELSDRPEAETEASLEEIMTESADIEETDLEDTSLDTDTSEQEMEDTSDVLDAAMDEEAAQLHESDMPEDTDTAQDDITEEEPLETEDIEEPVAEDLEASAETEPYDLPEDADAEAADAAPDEIEETIDVPEVSDEPIHMSQSDMEWYLEHTNDAESLRQIRDGITSGRIQVDADTQLPPDDADDEGGAGLVLTRDADEQWASGNRNIEDTVEAMRDDLRDKGMEDGPEMEAIVMTERARMQEELARNIEGDFSNPYQKPDFSELIRQKTPDVPSAAEDIEEPIADTADASDNVTDVPQEIDYDAVYEGLDSYDFDGVDYETDTERLDSSLESFQDETWETLSLDEQKAAMRDLADYVKDVIGFDDPPELVYYNNPVDGDYGGYSPGSNTLSVNEYMLYDNNEAADTIAHELWHAYQHERAQHPQSAKDYQYQYGFENYVRPEDDFGAYQDQLVEAEARAFAQQFKDRLQTKGRRL